MEIKVDLDAAYRLLKQFLEAYYSQLPKSVENADVSRNQFAGAKWMLEGLCGPKVKNEILARLRNDGIKIPHCGPRESDGFIGSDDDAER